MIHGQGITIGATLGMSAFQIVQSAESGSSSAGITSQLTIVGSGVAVFLYQERRRQREQKSAAAARRESDKKKDARIRELELEIRELHGQVLDEVRHRPQEG